MSYSITISDTLPGIRRFEPVRFTIPQALSEPVWWATTSTGEKVLCQRLSQTSDDRSTEFVAVISFSGRETLHLHEPCHHTPAGITMLEGREADSFVRLDTGAFDLEMCSGTAQGTGASKWGLRHFRSLQDDFELLPSGNNAIGGFYGPFFTPENGLINPPEHCLVSIDTIERGPVCHHYRMRGTIPDGLLDELKGKSFAIDWIFTWKTAFIQRRYFIDPFETTINGRSVSNKITVGDEFEGGRGELLFDRFAAYPGTVFRAGDPYAGQLVDMANDALATSVEDNPKFAEFRKEFSDIDAAHWDLYWRMFSAWEGVLGIDEIRRRLARVMEKSHRLADLTNRPWQFDTEPVNVSSFGHETIFAGPANKTVEFHSVTGRSMVWWTSQASGGFQIVQRRQSGWVNWGTNGENECPELPVGVKIKTAYGHFADEWQQIANQLETEPEVTVCSESAEGQP